MNKKIFNIIIFAVAIVTSLTTLYFSGRFDDNKKDTYDEVTRLKQDNPQMLTDFAAATPESLNGFLEKYQQESVKMNDALKTEEYQKNIEHTFIYQLGELKEGTFAAFKADFGHYSNTLLAKSERKDFFVNGFAKINDFSERDAYISLLEKDYAPVKQQYAEHKESAKAFNAFYKRVFDIKEIPNATRRAAELTALQEDVTTSTSESGLLNFSIILVYIVFFATIALLLGFAIIAIVKDIRNSYKAILAILAIAVAAVIAYFIASPEMTPAAISMQHTAGEVKTIGAGIMTFYGIFLLAIAAIIASEISNLIKNR